MSGAADAPWAGAGDARRHVALLMSKPGTVVELRALGVRGVFGSGVVAGYFDDPDALVSAAAKLDGEAEGIYVTLNPVRRDLIARAENRVVTGPKHATDDRSVVHRRLLLIDVDPIRPSGVSATEDERSAARAVADAVSAFLTSFGFPEPLKADSGNGMHLAFAVDLPTDDERLVERCLASLAFKFNTATATVDQKVGNPARICKLYGTVAKKGDNTAERPHRRSQILSLPTPLAVVDRGLLQRLAQVAPPPPRPGGGRSSGAQFDVDAFLEEHHLVVLRSSPWQTGHRWILAVCPFNSAHDRGEAYVVQHSSGALAAGCHHNSCEWGWHALRSRYEPQSSSNGDSASKQSPAGPAEVTQLPPFSPFPVDALPEPIRTFIISGAAALGCDQAFLAIPMLGALAGAIGNSRRIRLKRSWSEPSVLWLVVIAQSGTLKSPALEMCLGFLHRRQEEALRDFEKEKEEYRTARLRYDADLAEWKRRKRRDVGPPAAPIEPKARRLYISDTTIEALAQRLHDQPRGLLLCRDELAGWFNSFDAYRQGKGGDVEHWLEIHRAGPMLVDRKGGQHQTTHVARAAVSIIGGIQPAVLRRALGQEQFANGLAARLLVAMPPRMPRRWSDAEVPAAVTDAVERIFDQLLALSFDDGAPVELGLDDAGRSAYVRFYDEFAIEQDKLADDLAAAWSKLEGYAARLALVIHLVRQAAGDNSPKSPDVIDERSVSAAMKLTRWFGRETERVYSMLAADPSISAQREILDLIRRRGGQITVRDLMRACRRYRSNAEMARQALQELVDSSLGQWVKIPAGSDGGRPTEAFELTVQVRSEGDQDRGGDRSPESPRRARVSSPSPRQDGGLNGEPAAAATEHLNVTDHTFNSPQALYTTDAPLLTRDLEHDTGLGHEHDAGGDGDTTSPPRGEPTVSSPVSPLDAAGPLSQQADRRRTLTQTSLEQRQVIADDPESHVESPSPLDTADHNGMPRNCVKCGGPEVARLPDGPLRCAICRRAETEGAPS